MARRATTVYRGPQPPGKRKPSVPYPTSRGVGERWGTKRKPGPIGPVRKKRPAPIGQLGGVFGKVKRAKAAPGKPKRAVSPLAKKVAPRPISGGYRAFSRAAGAKAKAMQKGTYKPSKRRVFG